MRANALCALLLTLSTPALAQDAIDLHAAAIMQDLADIADWPVTVHLDQVTFSTPNGLSFDRSGATWPNYTPPGWEGPIQYTVWACAHIERWTCAGFIQMWADRPGTGAPLPSFWPFWWGNQAGGAIRAPFGSYAANQGDQMAFFLSAGDARGTGAVTSVRERSNVVVVALPPGDTGTFRFETPPIETPPVIAPPVVAPPTSSDTDALLSLIGDLEAKIVALQEQEAEDTKRILAAFPLQSAPLPFPQPPVVVNTGSPWLKIITSVTAAAAAVLAGIGASK